MRSALTKTLLAAALLAPAAARAQTTAADGNYAAYSLMLGNTPEAQYYFRVGDIDNLNFGWAPDYSPFSGKNTDSHNYPWDINKDDPQGTDRIMVPTSYSYEAHLAPCSVDGYANSTEPKAAPPQAIPIYTPLPKDLAGVQSAVLQLFIDDFQAPTMCSQFQVWLDGKTRAPYLEQLLQYVDQTGPVGKILSVKLPKDHLKLLADSSLSVYIDDPTTGAGDGFAVDFVKLLVNPKPAFTQYSSGPITLFQDYRDIEDGNPEINLAGATVEVLNWGQAPVTANAQGALTLSNLPVGLVILKVKPKGQNIEGYTYLDIQSDYADIDNIPRSIYVRFFPPKE